MSVTSVNTQAVSKSGRVYEKLYKPGQFLFTVSDRIDDFVKKTTQKENANVLQKVLVNPVVKSLGWFTSNFLRYDYNKMISVGKLRVAQAPIGALMMMFLPFTIAPRMVQALKRGEGDKSEFWDILRRDVPTIGLLLFALDPLVKGLNILKQKKDGMVIVPKEGENALKKTFGEVFSYSKLAEIFKIDVKNNKNPHILYEIAQQGNAKGMRDALANITKQWGGNAYLGKDKTEEIKAFNKAVTGMLDEIAKGDKADKAVAKKLSAEAFSLIRDMDSYRAKFHRSISEKVLPKMSDFMVRHARTRRLPLDILSFVMVAIGVGFMPVWFNDLWSRKKHAEKQAATQMSGGAPQAAARPNLSDANFDPVATFRALRDSSRIQPPAAAMPAPVPAPAANPFGAPQPFAPQPFIPKPIAFPQA